VNSPFIALLRRDFIMVLRNKSEWLQPLFFLVVVVSLFPLGLGPGPTLLSRIAPGVVWIAALLASVLSLDQLFRSDYDDGSLEQLMLGNQSLSLLVLAKLLAHWLTTGLPIIALSPLLAVWLNLPMEAFPTLVKSLVLGTPVLTLVGGIGAALTVGLRGGGQLLALLVFPLLVPVLIFATMGVAAVAGGMQATAQLGLMFAYLIMALTLAPFACAAALRISIS
jgi:heme exporter protein B